MKKSKKIWHLFAFLAVLAAITTVVMLLWNALIPAIIGWSFISYWQAMGLIVLSRLLLGGLGRHGMGGFGGCHPHHGPMHDKLHGMSRNERRDFIRRRMGHWDCAAREEEHAEPQRPE